ncbi:MAG: DUF1365 domain-containing protein [Streptosporangiaceae bacterium]
MTGTSPVLYPCAITHVRTGTAQRSFTYGSYLWLVDVDRLPRLPAPLRPLATFAVRDHFGDPAAPSIRVNVESFLRRHGIDLGGGRIMMLAGARVLGYQFNPLTVYWCYDAAGRPAAVLAEVHNTYSERHVYLLQPDEHARAEADKAFYVSPFLPMRGRYRLRLPEPGERLRLSVSLDVDGAPALIASVRGRRAPFTIRRLIGYSIRYPWASVRVTLLIRWQAIRLLARRVPLVPRPAHAPQEGVR